MIIIINIILFNDKIFKYNTILLNRSFKFSTEYERYNIKFKF